LEINLTPKGRKNWKIYFITK